MKKETINDVKHKDTTKHLPNGTYRTMRSMAIKRKGYLIAVFTTSLFLSLFGIALLSCLLHEGVNKWIDSVTIAVAIIMSIVLITVFMYYDFKRINDLQRKCTEILQNKINTI